MKNKNEYREHLADAFIKAIEEDGLNWKKGWIGAEAPKSAITGQPYNGINRFVLTMEAIEKGYQDNRWATFNQIKDNNWKLVRGAKGVQIEFWAPLNPETNKVITWNEANRLKAENPDIEIKAISKYYYVFNGDKIEGMPERVINLNQNIRIEDIADKISKNMGVEILNDSNQAYYSTREDKIHLPKPERFLSSYDYYSTQMHELAHATGAEHRLNRDMSGHFGTPSYAFEELVAEMSSAFMSEYLPYELPAEQLDNHKAYLQSWMQAIKDNPDYLMQAVRKADLCANYLEEKAELNLEHLIDRDIDEKSIISIEERYTNALDMAGYRIEPLTDNIATHIIIPHNQSLSGESYYVDGWSQVGEFLESHSEQTLLNDEELQKQFNNLIHPEDRVSYYVRGFDGIETIHQNFTEAINQYLEIGVVDGKTLGVNVDHSKIELATFDTVELKNTLLPENSILDNEYLCVNEKETFLREFKESNLEARLFQENAYAQISSKLSYIVGEAQYNGLNATENIHYIGRIANDSRPQDYLQVDFKYDLQNREAEFNLTTVHAGEAENFKTYSAKVENQDLREFFRTVNEKVLTEPNIKEAIVELETDYDRNFTLYRENDQINSLEKHKDKLLGLGYNESPDINYDSCKIYLPAEELKQIDRAKGDVHIFQDKRDAGKNFLGKKLEVNGTKKIQKLSNNMDLKSAHAELKAIAAENKLNQQLTQKFKAMPGRGL